MIYFAGRAVREIYLGNRPVASIYLGRQLIWQSRVCMEAGAVIVLTSDAALRTADGVTYTVEAVGGALSSVAAAAVPGAAAEDAAVWATPVVAEPYMRHIAPMQSASPPAPLAETMLVLLPSERGGIAAIGGPEQAVTITPGQGNDTAIQHIGTGIQQSTPVSGQGGILRNFELASGVHNTDAITGAGSTTEQTHTGAWMQKASPLTADGDLHGAGVAAGGGYDVDGATADGKLFAAWGAVGAVHDINPMYADTDDIAACAPASSMQSELEPGYAGIIPASCEHQTPTAAAELLGSYAGIRQAKTADGSLSAGASAKPAGAAGAPGAVLPAAGAVCAACMITRVYINPAVTAFDAALVSEMDILALAEIDQMAIQN